MPAAKPLQSGDAAGGADAGPRHNLPLELSSFVGREQEMAEVRRLLEAHRLVTLVGPGGCGKTRLSLRVASSLREAFGDGVWLVELAPLSDPGLVPQAVASAVGVREEVGRGLLETLRDRLGRGELLLVLDNCEHLIGACASLAADLLRSCPGLRVLATSREPLDIGGEVSWPVPPLPVPEPGAPDPGRLEAYAAVRLFAERAGAVSPDFALGPGNAEVLAALCRRLEGMPLAIELAASRVRVLSVGQILERLDDGFRLLRGGDRSASPRHQTLRATVTWSYDLLSEEERALLRRLSAFAGGFDLPAAEGVCGGGEIGAEDVLDLLSNLVDKSLVLAAESGGAARYRLLETVRQYGRERLEEAGETPGTRRRHARYYMELAETADRAMSGFGQEAWVERLELEHDNLRAALAWEDGEAGTTEVNLRLASALSQFWVIRGHFTEGFSRLGTLLELSEASASSAVRGRAYDALGSLYYRRGDHAAGDFARARDCYRRSVEIFRSIGDEGQLAVALSDLGRVEADLGEYAPARARLTESLGLHRVAGNEHGIAVATYGLGWLDFLVGDLESARERLEDGLARFQRLGDKFHLGGCVLYLGCLDCEEGDHAAARSHFVVLTELVSFEQYRYVAPLVVEAFVVLAATRGQDDRALRLAGAAAELRRAMGAQFRLGWQRYVARKVEASREAAGERGAVAWADGRRMTLEEAISLCLEEAASSASGRAAGPLSPRELEVLALVAEGLTDAQTAERLHLSPRTVGRHLESVYRKLGVSTRTAAARTAVSLGLL